MASADLIIAADFGTTGVKLGAVNADMRLVARAFRPYPLHLPGPDRAEQDPNDWWAALARAIADLRATLPDLDTRAGAMVFCAQMCGLVCADGNGQALRPALVWLDKRSAPLIRARLGGWPGVSGYGLGTLARWLPVANGAPSLNGMDPTGKMLWVRDHEPDVFAATRHLFDVRDWLVHRATGQAVTTGDAANLTWMMDTRAGREGWSEQLAGRLGLPLAKLPRIVDGSDIAGGLSREAAAVLGLPEGLPVLAGGGDVSAAAMGSGAVGDGALHVCLSSSGWVAGFFPRRMLSVAHSYATIAGPVGNRPLLIATQESAGAALSWLAAAMGKATPDDPATLSRFYRDLGAPNMDDPFFLPWLAGERVPVDDARLRGGFHGLSLRHDQSALRRAVAEGVAMNTKWAFSKVTRHKGVRLDGPVPLVGGVAANPVMAQLLADVLNRPVRVGAARMAGVLGAAAMAAPALGFAGTVWDAAARIGAGEGTDYHPDQARAALYAERYARLQTLRPALIKLYRPARLKEGST